MTWRCTNSNKLALDEHPENSQVLEGAFESSPKEQIGANLEYLPIAVVRLRAEIACGRVSFAGVGFALLRFCPCAYMRPISPRPRLGQIFSVGTGRQGVPVDHDSAPPMVRCKNPGARRWTNEAPHLDSTRQGRGRGTLAANAGFDP
jgi:hypothetical protein